MSTKQISMLLCGLMASAALHAQGVQPGQLVPGFGDGDGIKRVDFNDLSGAVFDSARAVVLINTPLGVTQKILVAGIAGGRRVGIVQLNANGSGDTAFGNNGRALSTRTNVRDFAGMVRMPNGDIVIGYSDDYLGADDGKDFFIEVFSANGQPKNIGGPEVQNQNYVDLSTDQSIGSIDCDLFFRDATAHGLLLTGEGNLLLVGEQSLHLNDIFFNVKGVFAEFNGASYGPVRPAWGTEARCRSVGGGLVSSTETNVVYDAVGVGGNAVHAAGVALFRSSGSYGTQENVLLGVGDGLFSAQVPDGFWRNGNSAFKRIRRDPNDSTQLLLFGDRESGTFDDGQLLRPFVGRSQGTALTPLFFRTAGTAQAATVSIRDGNRIPGSEQFWVVGGAAECTVANNCAPSWNSIVVGLSSGASLLDTYLPDARFAGSGWLRLSIPNYDSTPTARSSAWRAALEQPVASGLLTTDLFVVGEFAYNAAINDYDWFVAKVRVANANGLEPVDPLFRDGFE